MGKKNIQSRKQAKEISGLGEETVCFVISPIGKEESKLHAVFKEVLDYIIKPAFEDLDYKYSVIRADDINRTGSFIKDILDSIYSSHVVIADLTGQNPNVFYELGVRHSLRPRTILIAQNLDDIPSDLREYRTIIYNTSAKGALAFKKRIREFLSEIHKEPERPDNPVLDRLGNIAENKLAQVEAERNTLKSELSKLLSGKTLQAQKSPQRNVRQRFERILSLKNAERQGALGGHFKRGEESFTLPTEQGNFGLYFLKEGTSILGFWYVSIRDGLIDIDEEMADARILLEACSKGQNVKVEFIVVFSTELPNKDQYLKKFKKMKTHISEDHRKNFDLHLLDPDGLENWEKELGLRV